MSSPDHELDDLPLLRGEARVGAALCQVVVSAGLLVVLVSLVGAGLALLGLWQPIVAAVTVLLLAVLSWRLALLVPAKPLPVWSPAALVIIATAFTVWAGDGHSEQVLPRRDAGSYLQSSIDLARGHSRPIEVAADAVGGAEVLKVPGLTLASPAFFQVGSPADPAIQPQFMVGPSLWYSLAWWAGGAGLVFWAPAVAGGLGVLALGLLAAYAIGPRWAPLAAAGVALCFPILRVARSTYSEPLALLVLAAGLVALLAAARSSRALDTVQARSAGAVAGVLVAGSAFLRADGLRETLLLLPVAALASLQRQPHARPLLVFAGATTVLAGLTGWLTSSEYLRSIGGSLLPLVAGGVLLAAGSAALVVAGRRGVRLPKLAQAWLPRALAAGSALVLVVLGSRPLWQTVRQSAVDPGARVVAGLQARQGLAVDGGRTYAEQTLAWTAWWIGPIAVVLACGAVVVLVHRAASRWADGKVLRPWVGPFVVAIGSVLLTWYRPGITPDHPWADRRLVIVLPTAVLLVVAVAATLTRWSTRKMPLPVLLASSVVTSLALLVPTALATWPHRAGRVEVGSLAAVQQVCRSFAPGDVALMVDSRAANEWPQVLRGQCGVPSLSTTSALRRDPVALAAAVEQVAQAVGRRGSQVVLVAADSTEGLDVLGAGDIRPVLDVTVREDARLLERRPEELVDLPLRVWLGAPRG